jgi:transcriptional regulator with XRE-family HTH domain
MMTTFPKRLTIASLIRSERLKAGHVQKWAATLCGYSIRQWIYWERGEKIPSERALYAIKEAYPNFPDCI